MCVCVKLISRNNYRKAASVVPTSTQGWERIAVVIGVNVDTTERLLGGGGGGRVTSEEEKPTTLKKRRKKKANGKVVE